MKYTELDKYVEDNHLLEKNVYNQAGIYAITIDNRIAYVGESKDLRRRCKEHLYNMENASFLKKEPKYSLLLSAKLGGHKIDCMPIKYCGEDELREREKHYIEKFEPPLNSIGTGSRKDLSETKIEEVIFALGWEIEQ